jgi:hypothetical protein
MNRKSTRTEAFGSYDVKPINVQTDWSALSPSMVVVTLWLHEFVGTAGNMFYERSSHGDWHMGVGNKRFFDHLAVAIAHFGGIVRVIVVVRDDSALPRVKVKDCYAAPHVVMRVTHLDPVVGAFRLEQVVLKKQQMIVRAQSELSEAA